jgi:uncharacterized protein (DUF427 family)
MAARVSEILMGNLARLRYEPIDKRIRALLDGRPVVDTKRALLIWEPKRVVPSYGVPAHDVNAVLAPAIDAASAGSSAEPSNPPRLGRRPVYDPSVPFSVHTAEGAALDVIAGEAERPGAAFRIADDELDGYVVLDFSAFDAWYEEDELNVSHPRDPFHRIEIVHSSRPVRIRRDGSVLAESTQPYLLFESMLPVRYYLPPQDVVGDLLAPSETTTTCAYKGRASYLSLADEPDIAWTYRAPLREAAEVKDRIAFFNERVDLVVDGEPVQRPVTPWSRR